MEILDELSKARKSGYFDTILGERLPYRYVAYFFCIDILEQFIPLSEFDDLSYSIDGTVFARDGCCGYYVLLCDGSIGYINYREDECGRVSDSIKDLLELELNCAYSWHNYLRIEYLKNPSLLKEDVPSLEVEGYEEYKDAYEDEMPDYAELQKKIAGKLDLNISTDITKDVLPKLYQTVQKQPEFMTTSNTGNNSLGKLYK